MTSNLSAFAFIPERAEATPALWNNIFSTLSANIAAADSSASLTAPSGTTVSISTNLEVIGGAHFQFLSVGSTPPSYITTAAVTIEVNSAFSDYLYMVDSSAQKSSYVIGSRAGGTADGLNIWDVSAGTMIVSFSKQSVRFFQNVTGPVFDVGGALANTLNAATFGIATDSKESRIQAAISAATASNISRVYVPANLYPYSGGSMVFSTAVQMVREGGNWSLYDALAYGARGDGIQDDAPAFRAMVAATTGTGDPTLVARSSLGEIYAPPGTYYWASTVSLRGLNGPVIRGAGIQASLFKVGSGLSVGLELDGVAFGIFEQFGMTAVTNSRVTYMLLNYSGPGTNNSARENIFRDVFIGYGATSTNSMFVNGFGIGINGVGCNSNVIERVTVMGGWISGNTLMYQNGYVLGNGSALNVQDHTFLQSEALQCNTGCNFNGGSGFVYGFEAESNNQDFGIFNITNNVHLSCVRCQGSLKFLTAGNVSGAVFPVSLDNIYWATDAYTSVYTSIQTTKLIAYGYSGMLSIRDFQVAHATSQNTGVLFQVSIENNNPITVMVDGFSITNSQSIAQTFVTGFGVAAVALIRGFNSVNASGNVATVVPYQVYNIATPALGATFPLIQTSTTTATAVETLGLRLAGSDPIEWITSASGSGYGFRARGVDNFDGTADWALWHRLNSASWTTSLLYKGGTSQLVLPTGTALAPSSTFTSDLSLGLYRSGVQTVAQSYGTLNLATNAVRLSMRTIAASALTASAANTNVAANEVVFTCSGSGATLAISSAGTTWIFHSDASAKNT